MRTLKHILLVSFGAGVICVVWATACYFTSNQIEKSWREGTNSEQLVKDIANMHDLEVLRRMAQRRVLDQDENNQSNVEHLRNISEILIYAAVVYFFISYLAVRVRHQLSRSKKESSSNGAT